MYACVFICKHLWIICLCVCICICTCIYVYRCIYMYMCASECTCVYIYSYVCLFVYVHLHVFVHVWGHLFAPNHVQVFGSHFRVMWRSFRPGLPIVHSLLLQWSVRTLPRCFSGVCWISVGQPLPTSHLPVSSRTLGASFQGCRKPVDSLCLGGQGRRFHNITCYKLLATRKCGSEKGLGPDKVSLWKWARRWPPAVLLLPALQAAWAGFLSALLREALLIHPHENGRFIHIDIINEEPGSMLYQLTPQGKVKWAFFWRVVPKLRTVTHSK